MYPEYYEIVETPMDLTTIKQNINTYESVADALEDMRLIWKNCFTFNLEGSDISKTALSLGTDFEKLVEAKFGKGFVDTKWKKFFRKPPAIAVDSQNLVPVAPDSAKRPNAEKKKASKAGGGGGYADVSLLNIADVKQIVQELVDNPRAELFLEPVDPKFAPGYHDMITTPMDLGTIHKKLRGNKYFDYVNQVINDVRLVWRNCETYNDPDSEIVGTVGELSDYFESRLASVSNARKQELKAAQKKQAQAAATSKPSTHKSQVSASSNLIIASEPDDNFKNYVAKALYKSLSVNALKDLINVINTFEDIGPFLHPVSDEDAPGYSHIISKPMAVKTIERKFALGSYHHKPADFVDDVRLIWSNCMKYNLPESEFYQMAEDNRRLFEESLLVAIRKDEEQYYDANPPDYKAPEEGGDGEGDEQDGDEGEMEEDDDEDDVNANVADGKRNAEMSVVYEKQPKQKITMYTYDENGRKKRVYCTFRVRKYRHVLRLVMAHELAAPFATLQANAAYFEAVEQPLDLITIRDRAQEYQDMPLGFLADLKLVFDNWLSFSDPTSQIYQAARAVKCYAVDCYFQNFLSMISFKTAEDEECIREHKLNSRNPLPASGDPFASAARKETAQAAPKAAGTQHQSLFPTFSHKKLVDLENKLQLLTTGDERVQSRALRESARATAAQVLKETKVLPFVVAPTLYEVYDFGVIDPRADVEAHCEDAIFPNKFTVMRAFRIAVVPASKPQITAKEVKQYPYVPFTLRGMIQAGPTVNDKAQFIVSLENRTIVTQTRNSRESWVQVFDNLEGILNCLGGKLRRCRAVLNRVCISPDCQDFLEQVSSEFVDYYKNISSPMWFREIYNRLNEGTYDNEFDFAWDMRLVFRNCKMYNAPNSTLYKSADRLSILFEQLFVSWVVNIQDKSVTDLAKGEWEQWYDLRYFDSPEDKQAQYRCKLTGQVAAESDLVQCSSCEDQYLPTSVGLEGTKLKQKWFCSRCTRALELSAQNLGGDPYANDPKEADSVYNAIDLGGNCFVPAPDVGAGWCQARKKNRSGGLKSMFLSPLGYELEKKELIPLQKEFEEAVDKDLLSARAKEFQETLPGYKASGGRRGSKRRSTAKGRRDASKQQQAPQPSLSSASANAIADEQQDNNEDDNNVDSSSSILHPIDSKVLEKNRMLAGNMFGFQAPPGFRLALCGPENEEIIIDKHRQGQDVSKLLEAFVPIDPATVPSHGYFGFHISDIRLRVEGLDKSVDCAKYEFLMGGKMKDQYVEDIKSELQRLHAFSQGEKNIKAVLLHERWIFEKTKAFPTPPQRSEAMDLDDQLTNVKDGFRRLFPQKHFDGLEIVLSLWDFLDSCQSVGFTHFSLADLVSCIQQPANMTQYVSQVIFDEIGCICTDLLFQDLKWRRIFSPFNEQRWQDLCMIYPINVMTWTKVLERVLFIFAMPLSVLEAESLLTQPLQEETVMVLKVLSLLYNHPLIDAFVATSTIGEGDEALVIAKEALNDLRKAVFDALVVKPKESGPAVEGEGKDDDAMQVDDEDAVDETAPAPIATAESVAESLLQIFTNASSTSTSSTAVPAKCIAQWLKALCARLGLFPVDSANEEDAVDPEEEGYHAVNRTWGSFTFANAAFNSLDVIMPYHFMIKPPTAYEAKMTLLTSFERVLTLLHSSDSDDWNASDRLAVFSVIHDNCVVVNEFQRDVKEREQYLTRFETLEGTTGLDALTAETLAQGYSFIPEDSVCHFTGVPFTVLPDSEKWTVVPLAYRQSEVAPTATAVTITSSSTNNAMDVDGDKNEVCTIAPYLRQDPGTSDIVYALKDALNRVINCRKFVKREREQYEGYMETIVNNNFPRAPKLKLLSSMFLRSKPVGYDAEGNVYWLLNVQSKMTLFPFDSSRHAIDPTDSQTLEPCILLRDLTGTWYYHDARNMPKLIRDLNNPVACERLLRYRLAEKLTITSYALRDSTLLIKGYQTPWLDRKLNIERWLTDQQLYVGPNEMHRCRQLEALLGRAMEIRMHIYYAYLFKYDDEVERSSERAEKEAVLRKQRKYKEDCLEEIFDLHPRRGWNRLDLFTRFRQLSATCTATRIVSDPVIGKVITGNVLSKALFLQRNAIDPAEVAADAEGDDDLPPPPPPPSSSAVPSSVVGHQQQPVASSSSSVSATNVAAVVKQEERTPTKEEENTAMEVDEPSSAPPVILKEAESTVAETKQQTTNTKDKMQQVDQIESSFRETTSNNNPPNTADEERHELGIIHRNVPNYEQNGSWPQKSTRAVEQLHSETNEVLRIYPSGRHVSMFLDVSQSGISQCLNNIKPDCYGFKWRWYAGPSLDCKASLLLLALLLFNS